MGSVATSDEQLGAAGLSRCEECHVPLACDQRYCVECGTRRGPLPPPVAELIGLLGQGGPAAARGADEREASAGTAGTGSHPAGLLGEVLMLSRSAAAVAVMALLAFGVVVGSAVSPAEQSGAAAPIVVALSPSTTAASPPVATAAAPPPTPAEPTPSSSTPTAATGVVSTPTATSNPPPGGASTEPTTQPLPPITHIFMIVLSGQGFNAAFGPSLQAPYLSKTLTGQGELLDNYYAVTGGELANEIALVSGQGPTAQTATTCPLYTDITPGTVGAQGQVLGSGCVYPRDALTVADQLTADGRVWRAYVEGIDNSAPGQPMACRHPALGSADAEQAPTSQDAYVTWRDPFVYFHTVIDNATCTNSVVGLDRLAPDLEAAVKTPSLAYIVPDRCHDGSDQPCAPGRPSGLAAADAFLRDVVPEIERSPAYQSGGLIAITFDQAPQSGPDADSSGCCITSAYPNLPAAGTGATGATGTTGTTNTTAATGTTSTTGATGTTTMAGSTTATPAGGGRVGLLLISRYVKPASINVTGDYDHFSLLASIDDLFGLTRLGYAGAQGLLAFDTSVYNAYH